MAPKYDDTLKKKKSKAKNKSHENVKPHEFKKGQSGNPRGRPVEPPELKLMKRLTRQELVEVGELVIMGDIATLKRLRTDDRCTVLKGMFISVCLKILRDGDMEKFDKLISRFIGKVKDEIDLNHSGEVKGRVLVMLPSNGREKK
jgi:hypothetical protein